MSLFESYKLTVPGSLLQFAESEILKKQRLLKKRTKQVENAGMGNNTGGKSFHERSLQPAVVENKGKESKKKESSVLKIASVWLSTRKNAQLNFKKQQNTNKERKADGSKEKEKTIGDNNDKGANVIIIQPNQSAHKSSRRKKQKKIVATIQTENRSQSPNVRESLERKIDLLPSRSVAGFISNSAKHGTQIDQSLRKKLESKEYGFKCKNSGTNRNTRDKADPRHTKRQICDSSSEQSSIMSKVTISTKQEYGGTGGLNAGTANTNANNINIANTFNYANAFIGNIAGLGTGGSICAAAIKERKSAMPNVAYDKPNHDGFMTTHSKKKRIQLNLPHGTEEVINC